MAKRLRSSRKHAERGGAIPKWACSSWPPTDPKPFSPSASVGVPLRQVFARQFAGLSHPVQELSFIELILINVQVAHFRVFGLTRRDRSQRPAAEEGQLDVLREAVKAEEPAPVLET